MRIAGTHPPTSLGITPSHASSDCLRMTFYCVSLSRNAISSKTYPSELPHSDILQSRECQKRHWKALHKMTCPGQAAARQNVRQSPEQKDWTKRITRWTNAWTVTITYCYPLALDLPNHGWGHHDTHWYVSYPIRVRVFLTRFLRESLVMRMESTGLDQDCELFRVRKRSRDSVPSGEI